MFHGVSIESFIAGFAYGGTTVIVGQPFETLKTLTQLSSSSGIRPSIITTAKELYTSSGIKGFYRGGTPLLIGGGLMRSAQFGFYNSVLPFMDTKFGKRTVDSILVWMYQSTCRRRRMGRRDRTRISRGTI